MPQRTSQKQLLLTWIGQTDLNASRMKGEGSVGPVAQALEQRNYDQVVLLSNYGASETSRYLKWLKQRAQSTIETKAASLSTPTAFGEIYDAVIATISDIHKKLGNCVRLTYHLSPGTPAMAAVWIIVAKTRFAAELIESSREHGVRTATVPFDISAELIPDLFRQPDSDLVRLGSGLAEAAPAFSGIIHRSPAMKRVIAMAQRIAPRTVPVLIEGESGTGKELLARAIHQASPRQAQSFITVNCGAISPELAESEFFGHKKGAFTGATTDRAGHFEEAQGGTLFLDEIGELPPAMQVKLLRVLQENEVIRVGTSKPIPIDVRIVAATNRSLTHEVASGQFREDLFFRIAVAVLNLPPLRHRTGDISPLIDHLMDRINDESATEPAWENKILSPSARNLLLKHTWPGNIRELANTLMRAAVWSPGNKISRLDVEQALLKLPGKSSEDSDTLNRPLTEGFDLQGLISGVAVHYLTRAMKETGGNKTRAAQLLGLPSYQTLNNWLKRYDVKG